MTNSRRKNTSKIDRRRKTSKVKKSNKALVCITVHHVFTEMSSSQSLDSKKVREYMFVLFRDYTETENNQNVVKNIIIDELQTLKNHILDNYKKELLINMNTDLKYNHHYCLTWMLCKWFPCYRLMCTPFWYQVVIRNSNKHFKNVGTVFYVPYLDLVDSILKYLR